MSARIVRNLPVAWRCRGQFETFPCACAVTPLDLLSWDPGRDQRQIISSCEADGIPGGRYDGADNRIGTRSSMADSCNPEVKALSLRRAVL